MGSVLSFFLGGAAAGEDPSSGDHSGVTAFHSSARWQLHFNSSRESPQLSFCVIKLLLDQCGTGTATSYFKHWVALTENFSQVVRGNDDASGRVMFESIACITTMLTAVAQGLKATSVIPGSEPASTSASEETMKRILDHAKTCGLVEQLCISLAKSGSSLISGSLNMLCAACEACKAIWTFVDATETIFMKANAYLFPLNALRSHSLLRLDIRDQEQCSLVGADSARIIDVVTRAFLRSKAMQVAIYHCLQQQLEAPLSASIQLLSRCCLHNAMVPGVLCGLPSSLPVTTVVSGGGDRTIVSEIFSILSLCASSLNKDPQMGDTSNMKSRLANPSAIVLHASLILATVAQCLKSTGRNSVLFMLTTSPKYIIYTLASAGSKRKQSSRTIR